MVQCVHTAIVLRQASIVLRKRQAVNNHFNCRDDYCLNAD